MVLVAFRKVFSERRYALIASAISLSILSLIAWLPNTALISAVFSSSVPLIDKLFFVVSLYGALGSTMNTLSLLLLLVTVVMFGINTAFLSYYIMRARTGSQGTHHLSALGLSGMVSSVFGIGCAACGSVILTSLFTLTGASSVILLLPLHGQEFVIIGIVLLGYSIILLSRKILDPLVCEV